MGLCRVPCGVVLELQVDLGRGSLPPRIEKQNDYFSRRNKQQVARSTGVWLLREICRLDQESRRHSRQTDRSRRKPLKFNVFPTAREESARENEGRRRRNRFAGRKTADADSEIVLPPGRLLTPTAKSFCRREIADAVGEIVLPAGRPPTPTAKPFCRREDC